MSTAVGGCKQGGGRALLASPCTGTPGSQRSPQPAPAPACAQLRIPLAPPLRTHRARCCAPPCLLPCTVPRVPSASRRAPQHVHPAMPDLPPLLPLSLSPWRWPGDSTEHSCADERQARGLQVTVLGSGAGGQGWQRAPRRVCTLLPSAAPAPRCTEGAAVPRAVPCQRQLLLTAHPALPRPRSLLARHYFYQNFREVPGSSSPGIYLGPLMSQRRGPCQALPAARPAERTNRRCRPMGTAPRAPPGSAARGS